VLLGNDQLAIDGTDRWYQEVRVARYLAAGNAKALERFKRMSPVAWRHIHLLGHYLFKDQHHPIDLEALLAGVELD
jgi:hypothetical protein